MTAAEVAELKRKFLWAAFAATSRRDYYDPNQPRDPAGSATGGQWSGGGGGGGASATADVSLDVEQTHIEALHSRMAAELKAGGGPGMFGERRDTVLALGAPLRARDQSRETWAMAHHISNATNDASMITTLDSQMEWSRAWAVANREWQAASSLGGSGSMGGVTRTSMKEKPPNLSPTDLRAFEARRQFVQAQAAKEHGQEIVVYRGIRGRQATALRDKVGQTADLPVYQLSSWSTSRGMAAQFAGFHGRKRGGARGVIVKTTISPRDVWSMPKDLGPRDVIRFVEDAGEIVTLNPTTTRRVEVVSG